MTHIPKSVKLARQIFQDSNDILHSLFDQSQKILHIEAVIRRYVDKNFSVSSLKNNHLVLVTDNGANATNLRYRQRNLITALRQEGFEISHLKVKVQPKPHRSPRVKVQRVMSPETAEHLIASAEGIDHLPLRKALINLSKRAS